MGKNEITFSGCYSSGAKYLKCNATMQDGKTYSDVTVSLDQDNRGEFRAPRSALIDGDFYCEATKCKETKGDYKPSIFKFDPENAIEQAFSREQIVFGVAGNLLKQVSRSPQEYRCEQEPWFDDKGNQYFIFKLRKAGDPANAAPILSVSEYDGILTLGADKKVKLTDRQLKSLKAIYGEMKPI